jgi:hypothetical protein
LYFFPGNSLCLYVSVVSGEKKASRKLLSEGCGWLVETDLCCCLGLHARTGSTCPALPHKEVAVGKSKKIKLAITRHSVHQDFTNLTVDGGGCQTTVISSSAPISFRRGRCPRLRLNKGGQRPPLNIRERI